MEIEYCVICDWDLRGESIEAYNGEDGKCDECLERERLARVRQAKFDAYEEQNEAWRTYN